MKVWSSFFDLSLPRAPRTRRPRPDFVGTPGAVVCRPDVMR